jgi:hypothetical protein
VTQQNHLSLVPPPKAHFNGSDYDAQRDDVRLRGQQLRIWTVMSDGVWRTLRKIAERTGDPEASISAQLRHLRKPRFGSFIVDKRHLGSGLYEYRVTAPN